MSEKIYAWLLRVFLPHFHEAYGDEALNYSATALATRKDSS
jgi:hypothetical protein